MEISLDRSAGKGGLDQAPWFEPGGELYFTACSVFLPAFSIPLPVSFTPVFSACSVFFATFSVASPVLSAAFFVSLPAVLALFSVSLPAVLAPFSVSLAAILVA